MKVDARVLRSRRTQQWLAAGWLGVIFTLAGCGGGGGGDNAAVLPAPQTRTAFTPNYISSLSTQLTWGHMPITIAFTKDANWSAQLQQDTLSGFDEWVNATNHLINYQVVATSATPDVLVSFDPTQHNSHTQTTFQGTTIIKAVIQVGTQDIANPQGLLPDDDLQAITAHEIGHMLGIGGHSPTPGDLMFGQRTVDAHIPGPVTTNDLNTLKTIYSTLFTGQGIPPNGGGPGGSNSIQ